MKRCKHIRAWYSCRDGVKRAGLFQEEWSTSNYGYDVPERTVFAAMCRDCGVTLSLGPSNDEPAEVQHAMLDAEAIAKIGGIALGWELWDVDGDTQVLWPRPDDWSWDISRPLAEQLAETARDDELADALSVELFAEIDADKAAKVYEAARDAEPDCRDEDDIVTYELGAHDPNEDAMRDPAVTAHNAEVIAQRSLVASPEVCACTGDALRSETCGEKWQSFDPFGAIVPGDFGGPHGDIP